MYLLEFLTSVSLREAHLPLPAKALLLLGDRERGGKTIWGVKLEVGRGREWVGGLLGKALPTSQLHLFF